MKYEIIDCIDAGTEYCPCHLAESGECILCSQLCGKNFCDCINWKGVCIYQEYNFNGNKNKSQRKNYLCKVMKKEIIEDNLVIFSLLVPHKIAQDLLHPGSYIFMRNPQTTQFYDTPISILDVNLEENIIKVAVEIQGIKTKNINKINEDEKMLIRAPFWNGVFGLNNIVTSREGHSVIIARGIGMAPMIPILKKLYANGNKITVILDKAEYKTIFVEKYLEEYEAEVINCETLKNGDLSEDLKKLLSEIVETKNINLFHCAGADILIYNVLNFIDPSYKISCCNNIKMCCGEGVCGSCSTRYRGHIVKRLCKVQTDPRNIFEGRRLL
ncbi:sulfide/dihydroorotate dehydrogenase-like FAD/NAD-binding protein [Desnuesiella massiliensis]|uniref:sulfide/dihydroorotate dehydrogenase-like FAD/NAD-binding protein n=1 Tax=Desnuesiella massiliensis TaxID=1650662 RepID=UPI0006E35400|nr:sulfide/dihydroorotate dehydrogenase-like FAD/NAD-binding protein [Desnuesiella massiliensis]